MVDRYCVPTSFPCRLTLVESCVAKKTVRRSLYAIRVGSNSILITSACPVLPVQTDSYVGACPEPVEGPPAYPGVTEITPRKFSNTASVHQKHPPPNIAVSLFIDVQYNKKLTTR